MTLGGQNINYVYDASGVKLRKTVQGVTTDYAGNYIYENNTLQFFNHPEGYVKKDGSAFNYVYQYKDHLGNIRLSYTDKNQNSPNPVSIEIIEESNYYPFGLKHKGYNNVTTSNGNSIAQKYKYNGKELNEELGLDWYDFGARNYDAALGRWMNLDPLAENGRRWSPYNNSFNNPIYFQDPDGMWPNPFQGFGEGVARAFRSTFSRVGRSFNKKINNINNGINNSFSSVKKNVVENKDNLLEVAEVTKLVGDSVTSAGLIVAGGAALASATGIGAIPGIPTVAGGLSLAATGGAITLSGEVIELTTNLISGDMESAEDNVLVNVISKVVGKLFDRAVPGSNPDISPAVKDLIKTGNETIKNITIKKVKEEVNEVIDN